MIINRTSQIRLLLRFASFILLVNIQTLIAQPGDGNALNVDHVTLTSKILGEDRVIYIQSPKNASSTVRYPVLYLLDGESHFELVGQYCAYLGRWDVSAIPEMIVVGITNTDRARDLTPSHTVLDYFGKENPESWLKTSGGNEKFFQFIQQEVVHYVESHYQTEPFKIFAGHSFGGITTVNCMLTHPDMFNAYIAVSPSFWWDRNYLLKLADQKLSSGSALNKFLFYSDGNEGTSDGSTFHTNVLKFDSLLHAKAVPGLNYEYKYYPDETHMTVPVDSYREALRFIFNGWRFPSMKGEEVTGEKITQHYEKLSKRYGYTMRPNEKFVRDWASHLMKSETTRGNAISMLETLGKMYPSSVETLLALGDAYVMNREKPKAMNCYQKAVTLDAKSSEAKKKLKELQ